MQITIRVGWCWRERYPGTRDYHASNASGENYQRIYEDSSKPTEKVGASAQEPLEFGVVHQWRTSNLVGKKSLVQDTSICFRSEKELGTFLINYYCCRR